MGDDDTEATGRRSVAPPESAESTPIPNGDDDGDDDGDLEGSGDPDKDILANFQSGRAIAKPKNLVNILISA